MNEEAFNCQPDGAISGSLALAAGKQLHAHVDVREYAAQVEKEQNFWTRRVELMSSHRLLLLVWPTPAARGLPRYNPLTTITAERPALKGGCHGTTDALPVGSSDGGGR